MGREKHASLDSLRKEAAPTSTCQSLLKKLESLTGMDFDGDGVADLTPLPEYDPE